MCVCFRVSGGLWCKAAIGPQLTRSAAAGSLVSVVLLGFVSTIEPNTYPPKSANSSPEDHAGEQQSDGIDEKIAHGDCDVLTATLPEITHIETHQRQADGQQDRG